MFQVVLITITLQTTLKLTFISRLIVAGHNFAH